MKTLALSICLMLAYLSTFSQTSTRATVHVNGKEEAVPAIILEKFRTEYPDEQATWSIDEGYYRASFIDTRLMNGHAVAYNKTGTVVYREEQLAKGAYPSKIDAYLATKYPQDKIGVWSSMDRSGKPRYFSSNNNELLWFDETGAFVKTVKRK